MCFLIETGQQVFSIQYGLDTTSVKLTYLDATSTRVSDASSQDSQFEKPHQKSPRNPCSQVD